MDGFAGLPVGIISNQYECIRGKFYSTQHMC